MARTKSKGRTSAKRGRATRRDGFTNASTGHGMGPRSSFRGEFVNEIEAAHLWASDWVIARVIEMLPRDAMRPGFSIKVGDDGDEDGKEVSKGLMAECKRLGVAAKITQAGQWRRAYKGAALFPVLDGAVGDLEEPLDDYEDAIISVTALHLLEPRELMPVTWYTDMASPKFRRPETYRFVPVGGAGGTLSKYQIVHESRLAIFQGIIVSNQLQPGQRPGWGQTSVVERVRQVASDLGISWSSVAALLRSFAQGVLKLKDLREILKMADGEQQLARRLNALDSSLSSVRTSVIDGDDEYSRLVTPVTGLEGLMIQLAQLVCAAAEIPATRLLGTSPAGMNATGESDTRGWYDTCAGELELYCDPLRQIIRLLALQNDGPCEGVEPEHWATEWNPPWLPTEKEVAETRKTDSEAAVNWVNAGVASGLDIAKAAFGGGTYSRDYQVDFKAIEAQEKIDAAAQLQQVPPGIAPIAGAKPGAPKVVPPVPIVAEAKPTEREVA
jgi:hypothetical protein